jgi:hypothetical protein
MFSAESMGAIPALAELPTQWRVCGARGPEATGAAEIQAAFFADPKLDVGDTSLRKNGPAAS